MANAPVSASVHCPFCSEVVVVALKHLSIDDNASVYRVLCSKCNALLEKDLTLEVREILRNSGVMTLEEQVACFRAVLYAESDDSLWHTMYDVAYKPRDTKDS